MQGGQESLPNKSSIGTSKRPTTSAQQHAGGANTMPHEAVSGTATSAGSTEVAKLAAASFLSSLQLSNAEEGVPKARAAVPAMPAVSSHGAVVAGRLGVQEAPPAKGVATIRRPITGMGGTASLLGPLGGRLAGGLSGGAGGLVSPTGRARSSLAARLGRPASASALQRLVPRKPGPSELARCGPGSSPTVSASSAGGPSPSVANGLLVSNALQQRIAPGGRLSGRLSVGGGGSGSGAAGHGVASGSGGRGQVAGTAVLQRTPRTTELNPAANNDPSSHLGDCWGWI